MRSPTDLIWPMLAHMALVFGLYAWLSVARTLAVRRGTIGYDAFEYTGGEPPAIARITRNLSNQFELPMLFYVSTLLLIQFAAVTVWDFWAAWVFIAGRVLHTAVQTQSSDVRLRGLVFGINALAVFALVGHVAVLAWRGFT